MTNNVLPVFFSLASQLLCSSGISCELYTRIDTLNQTCCAAVWSVQGRFTYVIMEKGYHIMKAFLVKDTTLWRQFVVNYL